MIPMSRAVRAEFGRGGSSGWFCFIFPRARLYSARRMTLDSRYLDFGIDPSPNPSRRPGLGVGELAVGFLSLGQRETHRRSAPERE